jgi:hypothetical protein
MARLPAPMIETPTRELTHACVRCGRPVALDVALCEECNPLGLAQPAASQVHGTVVLGIIAFVVFLAVVAKLSVAGIGPYSARVVNAVAAGDGLAITISITNAGTAGGSTTCSVRDPDHPFDRPTVRIQTPQVAGGATLTFDRQVVGFGIVPVVLDVTCASP